MNYLIAFSKRSGSSFLCSLLRSAGALGNPYEVFEFKHEGQPHNDLGKQPKGSIWVSRTMTTHYASHVRHNKTANGVLGAKVTRAQYEHLLRQLGWEPHTDLWIWCRRRDTLRQAISLYRAIQSNQWDLWPGRQSAPAPPFDAESILQWCGWIRADEQSWQRYFADRGISPLTLWYEAFGSAPSEAIAAIADRLGVSVDGAPASAMRVQRDETSSQWYHQLLPRWQAMQESFSTHFQETIP